MHIGKKEVRRAMIDARYSVTDDGLVWSGELPLEPIDGVGVNMHGKRVKICYLVARAFVPNQEARMYVRHKNGDVRDNRAENLEWCDTREEKPRGRKPSVRWVKAWTVEGELVGTWSSLSEAARETGCRPEQIRSVLYGRQRRAGGLFWEDC